MSAPGLTLAGLTKLRPCFNDSRRVRALLRKADPDKGHCFTAAEAREAGCTLNDVLWAAGQSTRTDSAVERRLRMFSADCAARVLHIYEREYPLDDRPRRAIEAARDFANGEITDAARNAAWDAAGAAAGDAAGAAAWDAARAAAGAAAGDAARAAARNAAGDAAGEWQFARLVAWLGDDEPKPLRLPARPKVAA